MILYFFFFQAEDGIRDYDVTGVQTCALPIFELDNINLLYVALTRPIEQLHIISSKKLDKKGDENLKLFSGLFINYLKHTDRWDEETVSYSFGKQIKTSKTKESGKLSIEQIGRAHV